MNLALRRASRVSTGGIRGSSRSRSRGSVSVSRYTSAWISRTTAPGERSSFRGARRGQTTHRLLPLGGELDEAVYRELVTTRGCRPRHRSSSSRSASRAGRQPLRCSGSIRCKRRPSAASRATCSGGGRISRGSSRSRGRSAADGARGRARRRCGRHVTLTPGTRGARSRCSGPLPAPRDAEAEPPIVADIATAQELPRPHGHDQPDRPEAHAERGAALSTPRAARNRARPGGQRERAFHGARARVSHEPQALGLLALVVGMFLIYGTMSFAIVQRRATLGVLRAIGVTRARCSGRCCSKRLPRADRHGDRPRARSRARDASRRPGAAHHRRSLLQRRGLGGAAVACDLRPWRAARPRGHAARGRETARSTRRARPAAVMRRRGARARRAPRARARAVWVAAPVARGEPARADRFARACTPLSAGCSACSPHARC